MIKQSFLTKVFLITLAVFLVGGLCFAGGEKEDVEVNPVKELVIVAWEIPYGLDPVHEYTPHYLHSVGAIEYLLRVTPNAQIEPELAESFRSVDDTTWEVKLRPNVTFWSGKIVDAVAVKASLERLRTLCPQAEPLLQGVRIEIVDDKTLHFITAEPNPSLPLNLANRVMGIHNADSYGPKDNPFDLTVMDLTGFFKVTKFKPNQMMVLERWDGYWGEQPKLDRIVYKKVVDAQSRLMAALSGEAHIVRNLSSEGALSLKGNKDMDLMVIETLSVSSVYLHLEASVMQDIPVRKALAWGTDRQELVALARGALGNPASSWFATNPAYPDAARVGYRTYNPERAAHLLDEAGWLMTTNGIRQKNGVALKIRLLSYGTNKPASELLQSQWKKIGIQVEVQHSPDYGIAQSKRAEGVWEAVIETWGTFPSAQYLWRHFAPKGDINYGPVNNDAINQILDRMALTIDAKTHNDLVYQANQWIVDTVPIIPLYSVVAIKAKSKNVEGVESHFLHWYEITPDTDIVD